MNLLARREHSRLELRQKLGRKDWSAEEVEQTIEALTDENLQSDERFAESFTRQRFNNGYGPQRIRFELMQRGVGEALVRSALDNYSAEWLEQARDLRQRRFGEVPQDYAVRAKQQRFLQNRGYDFDVINKVFSE